MNVLILQGGNSPEREVSLRSAAAVAKAARELRHTVDLYDIRDGTDELTSLIAWANVVLPIIHGQGGEDGTIQEVLESYHVAFAGSDSKASKRCFDKVTTKKILEENGLPTPRWEEVNAESYLTSPLINGPYVLKPCQGGSSIDVIMVRNPQEQTVNTSVFERHGGKMIMEEMITGAEMTVGILGLEALPVVEIIPPEGKDFDYENKYNGKTNEICPPETISASIQEEAQSLAEEAHQLLGARHFSRVDLMMSSNGELYILEVNTIPGMTEQSLFPKAALAAGLPMTTVVERLINMAIHNEPIDAEHY